MLANRALTIPCTQVELTIIRTIGGFEALLFRFHAKLEPTLVVVPTHAVKPHHNLAHGYLQAI